MIKSVILLVFIVCFLSCSDDDPMIASIYFGKSSAIVNDELWEADVRTSYCRSSNDYVLLSIDKYENSILRNEVYFKKVRFLFGKKQFLVQDLDNNCDSLCTSLSTGFDDQAGDYYSILHDQFEDWILFDSINNETLEFWGRFQASFVRDNRIPKMDNYPDTLFFENGEFNGKILD